MAYRIRRIDYFYAWVGGRAENQFDLLADLAKLGINLVAFTAVPAGPLRMQLTLFPEDTGMLEREGQKIGLRLDGPHPALLVQGDDKLGALAEIHGKLDRARVNVYASSGVADGRGNYGYVLYVRPEDYNRAASALEV